MGVTPEGKVKKMVRELLEGYRSRDKLYYFMPVQGGYGQALLDFYGSHLGRFFAIETKAPGKHLTDRQIIIRDGIIRSGAKVFVIYDAESMKELRVWLNGLT